MEEGKENREFDGRRYLLNMDLTADFALIKAWKGDRMGNLVIGKPRETLTRSWPRPRKLLSSEVEELVDPGQIIPIR